MDIADAINRYRGPLIGLIISWGTPHVDAAEIAQESLADAWLNRHKCRGNVDDSRVFAAWLRGVAKNNHRNWARTRRRSARRISLTDPVLLERTALQPAAENEDHDELQRLRAAIERLPGKQKEVVMMHYLEETSVVEVAELLSVTPKAVEGRLYQARRNLMQMLEASSCATGTSLAKAGKALML